MSPPKVKSIRNMQGTMGMGWRVEVEVERRDRVFIYRRGRRQNLNVTQIHKTHYSIRNFNPYHICKNMLLFAVYFSRIEGTVKYL